MKINTARNEPFSTIRRRVLEEKGQQVASAPTDKTAFLGLGEADLTPPVRAAVQTLLGEIDDLRGEVGRLKSRLAEVENLADRDALTPLLNRRAFVREMNRVRTFGQRYGVPASLVYFDLDGFKRVNDRFGHAAGDSALQVVAERLSANVRESDVVGRMGGDEFAVILVQADATVAEGKAQALARAITGMPLQFGDWSAPLHVSYRISEITPDMEPEAVIAQADAAMYAKKREREA